jgi:hypothetical protein
MPVHHPFLLFLRSRLHLGLASGAGILLLAALLFLRPFAIIPILVVLTVYAALTGALFFSRRGAREVVAEQDEDRARKVREKIAAISAVRERISVLRIGDEGMARAIELFLQESGSYLDKCRELVTYSPLANERIERVRDICQVYLGEKDEEATDRRYGLAEAGLAEPALVESGRADPADPASLARDIRDCATVIRGRVTEDLLGTSGVERLAIMKELEEKK